ncbi:hypothetical protein PN451_12185 [Dolichospermum planctonicum CS-1226]|uniref:TPR repeat-containing protein n=1 Tax=Dolichospermum planctonicum CS-1226 TaxID=3021751 RepID=A0ABT5AH27_9CYAN|nr:hypothetical protein [Dolichospermum planctonicum]MDB9536575.1 hypothetical protein [Dolichospermum planctonicum CS-1226]
MEIETPDSEQLIGKIQLFGIVFDKLGHITTELKDHDYILAIKAYLWVLQVHPLPKVTQFNASYSQGKSGF